MTMPMKRKIVRCIELKLNGKSLPLYIDHAGFQVNQERVASLEADCGDSLPADYKEFLLAYNGARLLTLDESPKPALSYISNIKEVSDFALLGAILEGVNYEKNSIALIGSNHDGSVYTLMNVHGKKKGEIYHYHSRDPPSNDIFKQPAYKSFTDLLQTISKSDYAKQISRSGIVKAMASKVSSPPRDDEELPKLQIMPINSKKFPLLSDVVCHLFERSDTEENEYGRIVVKNKLDKRKIILLMTYVRDVLHEQSDNDIQTYLDYFSPFKMYLISESELEELLKEGVINENDEITKRGIEEAERIISEESAKLGPTLPKKELGDVRSTFKSSVEVVLSGKTTPLQLTQIGSLILDARVKKFEKDIGNNLPKEYREFLLNYNGGTAKQSNLIIDGNVETAGVKHYRDLQTLEERLATGGTQNTEWLAIGTDQNEHLVYLNLRGDKRGCLYRYKHDGDEGEEGETAANPENFTDIPKQLLAKSFMEFVMNVVEEEGEEEEETDEEYLESALPEEVKMRFPQFTDVMWTLYEKAEKQEGKHGRITLPNKQDAQNVILLVKYICSFNSDSFGTVVSHTPFKFFTILDSHIDDLKKAKLLSTGNTKITKRGKEEIERLLIETEVIEVVEEDKSVKKEDVEMEGKKGKKKEGKLPKTPPKPAAVVPDKTLKRKLDDTEARHTRSSTKEGAAAKKR